MHDHPTFALTTDLLDAMRAWLDDCGMSGAWDWSERRVLRVVERYFEGGVKGFALSV